MRTREKWVRKLDSYLSGFFFFLLDNPEQNNNKLFLRRQYTGTVCVIYDCIIQFPSKVRRYNQKASKVVIKMQNSMNFLLKHVNEMSDKLNRVKRKTL